MGRFGFGAGVGVGGLLNMQFSGVNLMTNHYEAFMKNKQQVMSSKYYSSSDVFVSTFREKYALPLGYQ